MAIPALDRAEAAVRQYELRALTPLQEFHRDQRGLPLHLAKVRAAAVLSQYQELAMVTKLLREVIDSITEGFRNNCARNQFRTPGAETFPRLLNL